MLMTQLANEASATVESTPVVTDVPARPAQRWLGYVTPVVHRVTGAVVDTQSAIEKRLGFCPGKELLKAASKGLDVLADRLHLVAKRLRTIAGSVSRPAADDAGQAGRPQAQA